MKGFAFILVIAFVLCGCESQIESVSRTAETEGRKTIDEETRKSEKDIESIEGRGGGEGEETSATTTSVDERRGQESGLTAGIHDDNKEFNRFLSFLEKYYNVEHYIIPVQERITLKVKDAAGKSIANAHVVIKAGDKMLTHGSTYADGTFLFFPSEYDINYDIFKADIIYNQNVKTIEIRRDGARQIDITFKQHRARYNNVPLDILFIFDTTGSMGEEINRLKTTIEIIYSNLVYSSSKPKLRFGMVLYRDVGDDYITRIVPLTENLQMFQAELDKVNANGGGDWDEDLQTALKSSMTEIKWDINGIRLAFIITDAPPHLDYKQQYTYVDACHEAHERGIKFFSIGTGELPLKGEYILRQISQYTYAQYIFLTYGERSDSEGGKIRSVSHHLGANYQTDKLETIIIQIARQELSYLTDQPLEQEEEYFEAVKIQEEEKDETLKKLFDLAISQLIDYSSIKINQGTRLALIPFSTFENSLKATAEYFTEQSAISFNMNKVFTLVERENMNEIIQETEFQFSDLVDEESTVRLGNILGAEVLIVGTLYSRDKNYELFLRLIRVETAEILSVTKLKIHRILGL